MRILTPWKLASITRQSQNSQYTNEHICCCRQISSACVCVNIHIKISLMFKEDIGWFCHDVILARSVLACSHGIQLVLLNLSSSICKINVCASHIFKVFFRSTVFIFYDPTDDGSYTWVTMMKKATQVKKLSQ